MVSLLLGRMPDAKYCQEEGDLNSSQPKKATFLTARHKQERFRFAYNFNVLDWSAIS